MNAKQKSETIICTRESIGEGIMSVLLEKTNVAGMELSNRFVRSATHDGFSTDDGEITDNSVAFLSEIAKGGVGLIILGFAYVTQKGQAVPNQTAIYDDRFIPGLRLVTEAVHRFGTKVALQIGDSGSQSVVASQRGYCPLAPSAIRKDWISYEGDGDVTRTEKGTPEYRLNTTTFEANEMTENQIQQVIHAHAQAARRILAAGFDGMEFHGGHGYLISQFASPATNRRRDRWGGSLENRTRFIRECCKAVRKTVGTDFPMMIKMGAADQAKGGLSITEGVKMAKLLEETGVDAIEITEGVEEEPIHHIRTGIDTRKKEAYYLDWARMIKKHVTIPLFLAGGLRSFDIMEQIVKEGIVDGISMCRPFIREPDLVKKYATAQTDQVKCISCNGCLRNLKAGLLSCNFADSCLKT